MPGIGAHPAARPDAAYSCDPVRIEDLDMDFTSTIVEFTRVYLAIFYSFVAAFYFMRITAKQRAGRREVVFPGARFCPTWWNHMLFRGFRVSIWMVCLWRWPFPAVDDYLGIIDALNTWPVVLAGNILLTAGFAFTVVMHFELGRQWRSGIDPDGPEILKTDGFYGYSRNPMFVGVAAAQAGFLLALPSVFSGVCLLIGWYTLYRQALSEEAHLSNRFPQQYRQYQNDVRRWI